jgi:hypothetical protein
MAHWQQRDSTIKTPVMFAREVAPIALGEQGGSAVNLQTPKNIFSFKLGFCIIQVFCKSHSFYILA